MLMWMVMIGVVKGLGVYRFEGSSQVLMYYVDHDLSKTNKGLGPQTVTCCSNLLDVFLYEALKKFLRCYRSKLNNIYYDRLGTILVYSKLDIHAYQATATSVFFIMYLVDCMYISSQIGTYQSPACNEVLIF